MVCNRITSLPVHSLLLIARPTSLDHPLLTSSNITMAVSKAYGLIRNESDRRDHRRVFGACHIEATKDIPVVNLSSFVPHDYNQGNLESCTVNALCSAYGLEIKSQHEKDARFHFFEPSRLFVYYNSRVFAGRESQNAPVSYRDALKSIHKIGVCKESVWPYDTSKFNEKPPPEAYEGAEGNIMSRYERLDQDVHQLKACLKSGSPFAFGIEVYENFYDLEKEGNDGIMTVPSEKELAGGPLGLHAVLGVGYNDHTRLFKILNSYGDDFGKEGYFYIKYEYVMNPIHCFDFWKIVHSSESDVPKKEN